MPKIVKTLKHKCQGVVYIRKPKGTGVAVGEVIRAGNKRGKT